MIVKCIRESTQAGLTLDKEYKVHRIIGGFNHRFTITNDQGRTTQYISSKFLYVSGELPPYKLSRVGREINIKTYSDNTSAVITKEVEFAKEFKDQKAPPVEEPVPEYCKKHFYVYPCKMCLK